MKNLLTLKAILLIAYLPCTIWALYTNDYKSVAYILIWTVVLFAYDKYQKTILHMDKSMLDINLKDYFNK